MAVIEGGITIESGITVRGNGPSFTLRSSDFTTYRGWSYITPNGTTGFTITGSGTIGQVVYFIGGAVNQGFNQTKQTELVNFYNTNGLNYSNATAYMYDATWGPASNPSTSVMCIGFYYGNQNNCQIFLSPVYTGDNNWQTSGQDIYNTVQAARSGTYNFPMTFTLIQPIITDPPGWC